MDPLLWTIVCNNMESPNDNLFGVLLCFLESGSMLPVSRYCLVYLCTVELFIQYLSYISHIGRVAAIWITSFLTSLDRGIPGLKFQPYLFIKNISKNLKTFQLWSKVCLTAVELQRFGYKACHVCAQLELVFPFVSALRWKRRYKAWRRKKNPFNIGFLLDSKEKNP